MINHTGRIDNTPLTDIIQPKDGMNPHPRKAVEILTDLLNELYTAGT